jgi:lamin B
MAQKHASDVAAMREERRALQENYDAQIEEYRVLMDIKVQLDQEIATYRALLQEEENR